MTTLTNDQITAGAAVLCDHGQPIGRNAAIAVFDAMQRAQPVANLSELLTDALRDCANALAYAAYNIDGKTLDELDPRLLESTGVSDSCLIAERVARNALSEARQFALASRAPAPNNSPV